VQVYGAFPTTRSYFPSLVDSRSGWMRTEIYWNRVEPQNTSPGYYDWTTIDQILTPAIHLDINVIGTILGNPSWASTYPNGPIDRTSLNEFVQFVNALVERYDGDGLWDAPCSPVVNYWEFYNEPDRNVPGEPEFSWRAGWGQNATEYAQMLAAVYPAIKAANPNAQVVFGGIAHDWFERQGGEFVEDWVQQVLEAGGGDYFDYMNLHAFANFWPEHALQPPGFLEKVEKMRGILQSYGYDKPFVVTETSFTSKSWESVEIRNELQARNVTKIFTQALAADVKGTTWFLLYDVTSGGVTYENGLVTQHDPVEHKYSFQAFTTMVELFEHAQFERALTDAETGNKCVRDKPYAPDAKCILAYKFYEAREDRDIYVAWMNPLDPTMDDFAADEPNKWSTLRFQAHEATQYNIYGSSFIVDDAADGLVDNWVTIGFGTQPVIVSVRR
jgi:hypothetical protein